MTTKPSDAASTAVSVGCSMCVLHLGIGNCRNGWIRRRPHCSTLDTGLATMYYLLDEKCLLLTNNIEMVQKTIRIIENGKREKDRGEENWPACTFMAWDRCRRTLLLIGQRDVSNCFFLIYLHFVQFLFLFNVCVYICHQWQRWPIGIRQIVANIITFLKWWTYSLSKHYF